LVRKKGLSIFIAWKEGREIMIFLRKRQEVKMPMLQIKIIKRKESLSISVCLRKKEKTLPLKLFSEERGEARRTRGKGVL